ncbi:MAG TPA: polyphosphate kinase 2 family protein [Streptosporangiaceae bacterium]|jgi:PPK2 family polyphosphate:nucleotide phosphotransferase
MTDLVGGWPAGFVRPLRVKPGSTVALPKDFDPRERFGLRKGTDAVRLLQQGIELLAEYQDRLAAQRTYGVLVVLQGIDAAGKDSTIRHVMRGVNPQGVQVSSFKAPSPEELAHDYLWRHARRLPARGEIAIFNRSHYEEVLVVRVHQDNLAREMIPPDSVSDDLWTRRYREINHWEHYLSDNGIRIVKLFLNLSKQEQRARFLRRIDRKEKNWKFSASDVRERQYWDDYQMAYSEMLTHTSTDWAPWYVLPADHKWVTRICAAAVIAHTLIEIDPHYPVPDLAAQEELARARAELEAEPPRGVRTAHHAAKPGRKLSAWDPGHGRGRRRDDHQPGILDLSTGHSRWRALQFHQGRYRDIDAGQGCRVRPARRARQRDLSRRYPDARTGRGAPRRSDDERHPCWRHGHPPGHRACRGLSGK